WASTTRGSRSTTPAATSASPTSTAASSTRSSPDDARRRSQPPDAPCPPSGGGVSGVQLRRGWRSDDLPEELQEAVDLRVGPHADAEAGRVAGVAHQADEDVAALQLLEGLLGRRAVRGPDEV